MFGAWRKSTSNGQTIQLRALDWDFDGPYKKYPMAVVYHPSSPKYGNTWMNIGFKEAFPKAKFKFEWISCW